MKWKPPKSPYNLLQESIWKDPWKIFVCCIFCNLTKRVQAEPVFWKVIEKWPTPEKLSKADKKELISLIEPLGLSERRYRALTRMSHDYISLSWKADPRQLYGIGKYGSDAYYLFCTDEWERVKPKDYALKLYQEWLFKEKANEHICA